MEFINALNKMESKDIGNSLEDFIMEEKKKEFEDNIQIDSPSKANYLLQLVLKDQNKIEELKSYAEKEIKDYTQKVQEWLERETKLIADHTSFISDLLKDYAKHELKGSKKKTLSLPNGKLSFKAAQPKITIIDNDALLEQLSGDEELKKLITTKVSSSVKITDLKKAGKITDGKLYINDEVIEAYLGGDIDV